MIVRARADAPSPEHAKLLGHHYDPGVTYAVRVGVEYVVFDLIVDPLVVWLGVIKTDSDYVVPAPLFVFDVVEPHVSALWTMSSLPDGGSLFAPSPIFHNPYAVDRLQDGKNPELEEYERLKPLLQAEASAFLRRQG